VTDLMVLHEVLHRLRIGRTRFWELRRDGDFPPPCLMGRPLRWRVQDVEQWIDQHSASATPHP
jgi:predicted DNA-binding transcriptional regulator AlpA